MRWKEHTLLRDYEILSEHLNQCEETALIEGLKYTFEFRIICVASTPGSLC